MHASDSADGSYWANTVIVMNCPHSLMTRRIFYPKPLSDVGTLDLNY